MSYVKTCPKCGNEFETDNFRKVKCRPGCGRMQSSESKNGARADARKNHETEFIGVDGEGINVYEYVTDYDDETGEEITVRQRKHKYVLLSVGDQSLHKNGEELSHDDIFGFLWEQFMEHPKAAFVGFFLGYDFTNWLKSVSPSAARSLLTPEGIVRRKPKPESGLKFPWPVRDGEWVYSDGFRKQVGTRWEFDMLATKRFKLRPYVRPEDVPTRIVQHKDGTMTVEKEPRPWMYICDAGPFFQTSFLNAINPKDWAEPVCTQEEFDRIEIGKTHRADAGFDADMIEYNLLENEVMARLMNRVNEGFMSDGIKLNKNQWFGPGQAAQTWMKLIGVPTGEAVREAVPQYARDAARKTYYGGWFEIFNHGPVPGTSYAYDINSAYPHVIATLPCLLHGRWSHKTGASGRLPKGALRMVYATFHGDDEWVGPMPYRTKDRAILRPLECKGWYWWHEVQASKAAGLIKKMTVHESVTYEPCDCEPPMAAIRQLYEGRLTVGKNSAAGKGKKLVYNSAYGKLAQSVGEPRFSNPIYASLITAGCRTMILESIATHPTKTESLLMIATDGIVFAEPHPAMDLDQTRLGAWDYEEYQNLSLFLPGVYWHDKTRQAIAEGKSPKLKSRGVSARDLAKVIHGIDRAWAKMDCDHAAPRMGIEIEWAMTTAKQAITRGAWWTCGEIVYGATRWMDGKPDTKRRGDQYGITTMWGGWRSMPYDDHNSGLETTYYDRGFGENLDMDDEEGMMVTQDGTIAELQAWAIHNTK